MTALKKSSLKKRNFFGAFVMTYERPEILSRTIQNLRNQTFPPEYILIVDNSASDATEKLIQKIGDSNLEYFRVGYNSGPAGASKIGLQKLSEKGFEWIYWGDDDNPPKHNAFFQHLFSKLEKHKDEPECPIGVIGGRGGNLNKLTGRIKSLSNEQLNKKPLVDVDFVPGGHTMLVNAQVVQNKILPDEKLFFGFEELDFCLRVHKKGFCVVTDSEEWLKDHFREGNTSPEYRWKGSSFGNPHLLWRNYYSSRNLLYILKYNNCPVAFSYLFIKTILKSFVGFRYGTLYGKRNFLIQWKAIIDFLRGDYGEKKGGFLQ